MENARAAWAFQRDEITEHHVYAALAASCGEPANRAVLERLAREELRHYEFWRSFTKKDAFPRKLVVRGYVALGRLLGLAFALKLMERLEQGIQGVYGRLEGRFPGAGRIAEEEAGHEKALLEMIEDGKLAYAGAVVLGLNDALVELTGTLAGLTFAFQNGRLIGATGLIMGFAASLSMSASSFLAAQEEKNDGREPLRAAAITGAAYLLTVVLLVSPYFLVQNVYFAMSVMIALTASIIAMYTFYVSVAKSTRFWGRFARMAAISFGVAALSFGVGWFVKRAFGVEL